MSVTKPCIFSSKSLSDGMNDNQQQLSFFIICLYSGIKNRADLKKSGNEYCVPSFFYEKIKKA